MKWSVLSSRFTITSDGRLDYSRWSWWASGPSGITHGPFPTWAEAVADARRRHGVGVGDS